VFSPGFGQRSLHPEEPSRPRTAQKPTRHGGTSVLKTVTYNPPLPSLAWQPGNAIGWSRADLGATIHLRTSNDLAGAFSSTAFLSPAAGPIRTVSVSRLWLFFQLFEGWDFFVYCICVCVSRICASVVTSARGRLEAYCGTCTHKQATKADRPSLDVPSGHANVHESTHWARAISSRRERCLTRGTWNVCDTSVMGSGCLRLHKQFAPGPDSRDYKHLSLVYGSAGSTKTGSYWSTP